MKTVTAIVLCVLAVISASSAMAARSDFLNGDPRICSYGPARKADCARTAAKYTLVRYMRSHGHPSWSNPTTCTNTAVGLLKWRCEFGTGSAVVWFRALASGWHRQVTVTIR